MARRPAKGTVEKAVERDLRKLKLKSSGLGESALELARQLDSTEASASAKASCSRALIRTLEQVRVLTPSTERKKPPPAKERDGVDDLAAQRARRRRRADA